MTNINKESVKRNLERKERVFQRWATETLQSLEVYQEEFDEIISSRKETIDILLYEIELLEQEKKRRKDLINSMKSEERKIIVEITEVKKKYASDTYSLYLSLKTVTETNKVIEKMENEKLNFSERISVRNSILTKWLCEYDVSEIYTNVNIDKFIKEGSWHSVKVFKED